MNKKVSIIFIIYKDGHVEENVEKLLRDPYPNKEFIVAVDLPTKDFINRMEKLKKKVPNLKIDASYERRGKVGAANHAVDLAEGDYILFIDADTIIEKLSLKELVGALDKYDLVDIPKVIEPSNWIGKLASIEYLGYIVLLQELSKIKRSIFLNGAIFAIKREVFLKLGKYHRVVIEDMDLATRMYKEGYTYHLLTSAKARVKPVESFEKWLDQRKRWAYGGVEWFLIHFKTILTFFVRHPLTLLIYMLMINPGIILLLLFFIIPGKLWLKMAYALLIALSTELSPIFLWILPIYSLIAILKKVLFMLLFMLTAYYILRRFAKKYGEKIKLSWMLGFWFFYSPIFLFIIISTVLFYLIFWKPPHFNWKV